MVIHLQKLPSKGGLQALGVPHMQAADLIEVAKPEASYSRIVGNEESVAEALLEAINIGFYLWANPTLQRTVISKTKPHGKDWHKVHATMRMPEFPPEAA